LSPTVYQRLSTIESLLGIDSVSPPERPDLVERVTRLEYRLSPPSEKAGPDLAVYLLGVSGPATYRSMPSEIDAIQWTGNNGIAVANFVGPQPSSSMCGFQVTERFGQPGPDEAKLWVQANKEWLNIEPTEWVARDEIGFYPIKDEIFQRKYRQVDDRRIEETDG
jgi:hypothetical protein